MKSGKIQIEYTDYDSEDELNIEDRNLLAKARKSLKGSYAPYSAFHVGAAVLLANNEIVLGSNQENAAYPSGLCAERVALFYANSSYPDIAVKTIAIVAESSNFDYVDIVTPCGSCRQVIAETEKRQQAPVRIIMGSANGKVRIVNSIEALLPMMYYEDKLQKNTNNE